MMDAQAVKAERSGSRAALVAWTLAGGVAGIVLGIVRVFDVLPGCIYRFTGEISEARLGFCADDFWEAGIEWFVVGAAIAGGVALFVTVLVTETDRRSTRFLVRVGLGAMLVAVGALLAGHLLGGWWVARGWIESILIAGIVGSS